VPDVLIHPPMNDDTPTDLISWALINNTKDFSDTW
jgi:hypothetical protein